MPASGTPHATITDSSRLVTDAPSSDSVSDFIHGVKQALQGVEETPWIVYGPKWARAKGAEEPPEELREPVWAPSTGWMEKSEAPIHEDSSPERLAMYAPDELEVDDPSHAR